jgi:hypothetical protein
LSTSKIQGAASALRNTRGLPWPKTYEHKVNKDLLDWLQAMFGFQERQSIFFVGYCMIYIIYVGFLQIYFPFFNILSTSNMQTDSVSNQREHLILLLANIHIRGNPKTDQQSKVLFCKYSTTKLISFKNSYFSSCFTTFKFFLFLLMFFLFSLKLTTSSYMILVAVG